MKKISSPTSIRRMPSLLFCVVMDLVGYASFAIPVLGEFGDIIWAPISAFIFFKTFGGWKGAFGGVFNFVEEILPGLDFIPTFTLAWILQAVRKPTTEPGGSIRLSGI